MIRSFTKGLRARNLLFSEADERQLYHDNINLRYEEQYAERNDIIPDNYWQRRFPATNGLNAFHEKAGVSQVGLSLSSLQEFLRLSRAASVAILPSALCC
jgi:hypothetical protein